MIKGDTSSFLPTGAISKWQLHKISVLQLFTELSTLRGLCLDYI